MSVAVLDFENLSRDTSDAYLSQGLAEELTSRLGQVGRLTVASRAAVRRLHEPSAMTLGDVGRALNVSYLVNGSLRRSGSRLRVTVELLRASSGAQEWTSQFDRSENDLLVVQEAVATAVAQGIAGRLLPAERTTLAARPTSNPEAHAAYLRGRVLAVSSQTGPQQARVGGGVQPRDRARLLIRRCLVRPVAGPRGPVLELRRPQRCPAGAGARDGRACRRAGARRGDQPHRAGLLHYWGRRDYARALQEFSAALAAEPNNADVHSALANVMRRQGSWVRSLASRTRSLEIDPGNPLETEERALTLYLMRRFDESERDNEHALAMPGFRSSAAVYSSMIALSRDGSPDRAAPLLALLAEHVLDLLTVTFKDPGINLPLFRTAAPLQAAVLGLQPPSGIDQRAGYYLILGQVLAVQGRRAESVTAYDSLRAIVTQMLVRRPEDDGFHAHLATAYAGLGRCDDALREAQRATELLPVATDVVSGPDRIRSLAEIEIVCGRPEPAIDRLAYLLTIPSTITRPLLRADPAYAPLRGNPRFDRLIAGP